MARRSKLTPEVQERMLSAIRLGATYEHAAEAAGVSYRTFRNWIEQGEVATSGAFFQFFQAVKRAEALAAVAWLAKIEQAANAGTWQAAAWKLERRYPEQWGRRERMDVHHDGEVQVRAVVEARTAVLSALADFPEAKLAVAAALEQLDSGENAS